MRARWPRTTRLLPSVAPLAVIPCAFALAGWAADLGYLALLLGAEVLAVLAALSEKAAEASSRAGLLEALRARGQEAQATRLLERLPAYLFSARILRFLAKAALVVGLAVWLLVGPLEASLGSGGALLGPEAWGRLAVVLAASFVVNFVGNDVLVGLLARRAPDALLARLAPLLEAQRWITAPLRAPLRLLVRLAFGLDLEGPSGSAREEVRESVVEGHREGALTASEAQMMAGIMDLGGRTVGEVLVPRAQVSMLPADTRVEQALAFVREDGHSRVPVYGRDKDDVLGVLYARDLLAHAGQASAAALTVRELMRPAYFVPESKRLHELLGEMKRRKNHLAVVVDELRATAGVISIEDVLEQIVGPIEDEHDEEGRAPTPQALARGAVELDARTPVEDVNRSLALALPLDGEAYDTLAGLLLHRLGKVPQAGERLVVDDLSLTVADADERRVKRVRLERVSP